MDSSSMDNTQRVSPCPPDRSKSRQASIRETPPENASRLSNAKQTSRFVISMDEINFEVTEPLNFYQPKMDLNLKVM